MSDAPSLNIFVPLSKVDEENRLVYGLVAEEIEDNAGEMFDYESSKPNFMKWSAEAETASKGLSKGNLRSMHGSVAAGVLTDLGFDDDNRRIECCAKVVDDNEWKKVLAGVYTGFSMGGKYEKRWVEKADGGAQRKRYTALPCEVSLVDKPCIPSATFDFVKADGMTVQVHHGDVIDETAAEEIGKNEPSGDLNKSANGDTDMSEYNPTNDQLAERGMALAKAAGRAEADWLEFMDEARKQLVDEHLGKADKPAFLKDKKDGDEEDADKSKAKASDAKEGDEEDEDEDAEKKDMGKADTSATKSNPGTKGADNPAAKRGDLEEEHVDEGAAATAGVIGSVGEKAQGDQHKETAKVDPDSHVAKGFGLRQVWQTEDGKTFLKKADAASHRDELADKPKTLAEQLAMAKAAINSIGEEPTEEDEAEGSECNKYADFFEKAAKLDCTEPLRKGLYEVSRMASALRECASLQICVAQEARREGDGSPVPAAILEGVTKLGEALVSMAQEEVSELTARLAEEDNNPEGASYAYPDTYMSLAISTLGLEKADIVTNANELLEKRAVAAPAPSNPEGGDQLAKADGDVLQKMAGELELVKSQLAEKTKEIEEAAPLIKSLMADVERIKALPRPPAPTTSVVMEKKDDASGTTPSSDLDLAKFTPDQLADAAIRMAQTQGRSLLDR